MSSSWFYDLKTFWIVLALLVAMALAGEAGCRWGRRGLPRTDDARRGHIFAVISSLLGLLALLLSFTFAMAADRYNTRRRLVGNEANALRTVYLQSSLLPEPTRKTFKPLLGQYVDYRATIAELRKDRSTAEGMQAAAHSEVLQDQMWKSLPKASQTEAESKVIDALREGLLAAVSLQRDRVFAWESHVPDPVIWLLLFGAVTASTVIGFMGGLGNHRGLPARIALTLLLSGTIYVILDLDKPHQGMIRVSQAPMVELQQTLHSDTETKYQ